MPKHARNEKRVLVVDDNEDAANSLAMILSLDGHEVRSAYSGPQALEQVESFDPDIVLLDIGLPVMDGYEVARRIRERPNAAAIRIIALTGYSRDSDKERALEAGFDDHVVKPVEIAHLRAVLVPSAGTA
jgi:CheY-like chemotaxis protein